MSDWQNESHSVQCRELKGGYWGYVTSRDWAVYRGTGVARKDLVDSGPARDMAAAKESVDRWERKH